MADQGKKYDLLIANGQVIDPANGVNGAFDVAVKDGKIAAVAKGIAPGDAEKTVDAKGSYVTPGLIDIHTHLYPLFPRIREALWNVEADPLLLRCGVTTAVDAGSCGWCDIVSFMENVTDKCVTRVLALINIAAKGMNYMPSEQTPPEMHPEIVAAVAKQFPDYIVGVKGAHYWVGKPFDDVHTPWASVDNGVKAAELAGLPFMIDFCPNYNPPGRPYSTLVLEKLRPGDIHTHVFAKQFPIVDENGKVYPHMWEARKRGVYFDVGHGGGSFWFRNAKRALDDGFAPDTLSTDLHGSSSLFARLDQLVLMSMYVNMGMPLEEVVKKATCEPAKLIRRNELGTLSAGACADIAVLRKLEGDFGYVDCGRGKITGASKLECRMTVRAGKVVFDEDGLSVPKWEEAPEDYWKMPFVPQNPGDPL